MNLQIHIIKYARASWPFRSPFKHKQRATISLIVTTLLFTCSALAIEPPSQQQQLLRRHSLVLPSSPPATSSNSNKRHLTGSYQPVSSAAEYFYANDKLADDQVAHFVNRLGHGQNSSSGATSSVSQYSPQHPQYQRTLASQSSSAVHGGSGRVSQYPASSVFPASLVSRASLPAQSSSSLSTSSSSHHVTHASLPGQQHHTHRSSNTVELYSKPSEGSANSLPTHHSTFTRQSKPQLYNTNLHNVHSTSSGNSKNHTASIRSPQPASEFDLSWVQPVYIPKSHNKTKHDNDHGKLQLNAFKSDPIDLFPLNGFNGTHNRTMLITPSSTESTNLVVTTTEFAFEDRFDSLSEAIANVTLKDEQWVAPIIAISTLNIIVILVFEGFVIYRACRTSPSRRHLFLGQMLLLGLLLSSVTAFSFVPKASWLTCTLNRAGTGICFAIVYGTLLVKTVFLLSLHTGVYLSAEYQALLLFFIISTQVAIDGQWLLHKSSGIVIDYMDGYGHAVYKCDHTTNQLLLSLVYVMVLILLIVIMAFRIRGYRENHGEALFIGITATGTVVLWLSWIAGTLTSTPHYRDGFVAFGLVFNASITFVIMFLPKGRQLAAVGREGHLDDRDQLSTASSPSIYTPSFLHIKPVSQLIPLGKPSIAGLSSVVSGGVGSGLNGGPAGYHLYKQFQGTGTTLTSPISTTGPPGPLSVGNHAIPNSYSSHAIFTSSNNKPEQEDEHNDPNYSNLSNVFTTAPNNTNHNNLSANNHNVSNLNSPISENNSSSTSSGAGSGSGGSSNSKSSGKSGSKSSQNSKSSAASHQQMVKSPSGTASADCFFYLQPPPIPPPSGRPPAPPGQQQGPQGPNSRVPWRQTCYTPNYHRAAHHQPSSGVGMHHYPKSLAGLGHYSAHHADQVRTPMGPLPPSGAVSSLHHHLLSPSSDNETTSFYFASFDAAGSTTRQLLADRERANNSNGNGGGGHHNSSNFKYFRGPLY